MNKKSDKTNDPLGRGEPLGEASPGTPGEGPAPDAPADAPADAPPAAPGGGAAGRFSYDGLERVIHEKARLSIMASLASHPEGLLFGDLKDLCTLTDGNLSRHLQMLQESGLVEVWKGYKKNRPQTLCRLTEAGRKRFLEYISVLESVVADALSATGRAAEARSPFPKGVSPA